MYNLDGIGIQFGLKASDNFGLSEIDLDHVVRADGSLEAFAEEIVNSMNSYTEYSPSGTGLHILCYTNTDNIGNRKKVAENCTLEIYNHERYFTYTGNVFRDHELKRTRQYTINISPSQQKKHRFYCHHQEQHHLRIHTALFREK